MQVLLTLVMLAIAHGLLPRLHFGTSIQSGKIKGDCCNVVRSFKLYSSQDFNPSQQKSSALDRELDTFFETAATSGSSNVGKLSPNERAELVARGVALEDLIYEMRDRLLEMENEYMANSSKELYEEIKLVREEINGLKDDYVLLVGAKDLPLYFGRPTQ